MYVRKPGMDDKHGEERYKHAKLDFSETSISTIEEEGIISKIAFSLTTSKARTYRVAR